MTVDTFLMIVAFILFLIAAVGRFTGRQQVAACGWLGLAAWALTLII